MNEFTRDVDSNPHGHKDQGVSAAEISPFVQQRESPPRLPISPPALIEAGQRMARLVIRVKGAVCALAWLGRLTWRLDDRSDVASPTMSGLPLKGNSLVKAPRVAPESR